jgi:DNA adenine methylase
MCNQLLWAKFTVAGHQNVGLNVDTYPVKPLIKWAGGKRQIAELLFSKFPKDWNEGTYFEPFIGGAAMFLHASPKKAVIADVNARLFGFYQQVKSQPEMLFSGIAEIADSFNSINENEKKAFYQSLRKRYNETKVDSFDSAILLYALNKLCFNGLYRENSKGEFNVPFGQKKVLQYMVKEDLDFMSKALSNALILNADFEATIAKAKAGDFVYLDPPYIPLDVTSSFTSYHSAGFGLSEQERLANIMYKLKNAGIKAMCSNSDTPLTHEIYGRFRIEAIQAPRMVSAKASGRGSVSELVITNY